MYHGDRRVFCTSGDYRSGVLFYGTDPDAVGAGFMEDSFRRTKTGRLKGDVKRRNRSDRRKKKVQKSPELQEKLLAIKNIL